MLHDATVEVTCDTVGCTENVFIQPEYVYRNYSEHSGYYDTSDKSIYSKLGDEGWFVADDKTYCEAHEPEGTDDAENEDDD